MPGLIDSSSLTYKELDHGGRLQDAIKTYQTPFDQWLDLSAALNPFPWSVPEIPASVFQRLPQPDDGLLEAAQDYYQCTNLLPISGSQAAIQALPRLRSICNVWVLENTYSEHLTAWQAAGHRVKQVAWQEIDKLMCLQPVDVIVLVNPDNPSGQLIPKEMLLKWARRLDKKKGWLIVDEAFMDTTPENSLMPSTGSADDNINSLIVLRSLGKFFGLAGIRLGFIKAPTNLLQQLCDYLGPWAVCHMSRWLGRQALSDVYWIQQQQLNLLQACKRLNTLLEDTFSRPVYGCSLFQTLQHHQAEKIHQTLAHQGILTRLYPQRQTLRFALPGPESQWQKLQQGLLACSEY